MKATEDGLQKSMIFEEGTTSAGTFFAFHPVTSELRQNKPVTDSVSVNPQREIPTPEQIRYWRQREVNKMFHGQDKEINRQMDVKVESYQNSLADLKLPVWPVRQHQHDWLVMVVFLAMALFATVRHGFANYLGTLFQSILNTPVATRMYRERNLSLNQGEIRLEIFSYLVMGLYVYQSAPFAGIQIPFTGFPGFLISAALVASFILLKKLFYLTTGFIIERTVETGEFIYNISNHIRVMGIVMLPLVIFIAWLPAISPYKVVIAGLVITLIIYMILLMKGVFILIKKQFSVYYLFLYLCTLEILPLLWVVKLMGK